MPWRPGCAPWRKRPDAMLPFARVTIIGVVPEDLGLGTDLSPCATVARGEAAALVAAELRDLGLAVSPRRERVGVE